MLATYQVRIDYFVDISNHFTAHENAPALTHLLFPAASSLHALILSLECSPVPMKWCTTFVLQTQTDGQTGLITLPLPLMREVKIWYSKTIISRFVYFNMKSV